MWRYWEEIIIVFALFLKSYFCTGLLWVRNGHQFLWCAISFVMFSYLQIFKINTLSKSEKMCPLKWHWIKIVDSFCVSIFICRPTKEMVNWLKGWQAKTYLTCFHFGKWTIFLLLFCIFYPVVRQGNQIFIIVNRDIHGSVLLFWSAGLMHSNFVLSILGGRQPLS